MKKIVIATRRNLIMKLHIDTTDEDEIKCEIDAIIPYDLGICIGAYIDHFSEKDEKIKIKVAAEIARGILDSVNQEVIKKVLRRGK